MNRTDWWQVRGAVTMGVLAVGALLYADNWAKKIFGFLIAGGCAAYEFQRVRARQRFQRDERRRIAAEFDEE